MKNLIAYPGLVEWINTHNNFQIAKCYTFTIPNNVGTDWNDIYCKIYSGSPGVPETIFGYENALVIVGQQPSISEFTIVDFAKV